MPHQTRGSNLLLFLQNFSVTTIQPKSQTPQSLLKPYNSPSPSPNPTISNPKVHFHPLPLSPITPPKLTPPPSRCPTNPQPPNNSKIPPPQPTTPSPPKSPQTRKNQAMIRTKIRGISQKTRMGIRRRRGITRIS